MATSLGAVQQGSLQGGEPSGGEPEVLSIDALNQRARVSIDPNKGLTMYIRAATNIFREANNYQADGDLQRAYELFMRFSLLVLEEMPKHPEFGHAAHQKLVAVVKKNCNEALNKLEMIKPILEKRFRLQQQDAKVALSPALPSATKPASDSQLSAANSAELDQKPPTATESSAQPPPPPLKPKPNISRSLLTTLQTPGGAIEGSVDGSKPAPAPPSLQRRPSALVKQGSRPTTPVEQQQPGSESSSRDAASTPIPPAESFLEVRTQWLQIQNQLDSSEAAEQKPALSVASELNAIVTAGKFKPLVPSAANKPPAPSPVKPPVKPSSPLPPSFLSDPRFTLIPRLPEGPLPFTAGSDVDPVPCSPRFPQISDVESDADTIIFQGVELEVPRGGPSRGSSPVQDDLEAHISRFESLFPDLKTPVISATPVRPPPPLKQQQLQPVQYPSLSSAPANRLMTRPLPTPPGPSPGSGPGPSFAPSSGLNWAPLQARSPSVPPPTGSNQGWGSPQRVGSVPPVGPVQPPPLPSKPPALNSQASAPPPRPPKPQKKPDLNRVLGRLENSRPLRTMFVPSDLVDKFEVVARPNTDKNLETCGILCGTVFRGELYTTHLVIPKQISTSDTCATTHEEELFVYQDKHNLLTLGWIHTHPTQTCFMSSVDLHTHCSYQGMLDEAVAIVLSPRHIPRYDVFRLTHPPGLDYIMQCPEKSTFHPHPEHLNLYTSADARGSPGCGHVVFVGSAQGRVKVVDLRHLR